MVRYDPEKHHRRSIRSKGYDYSQAGAYFVTICMQNRSCLLGEIREGIMGLNDAGIMIWKTWLEIPDYYPGVDVDAFIVMPNHIHGVILLAESQVARSGQARGPAPTAKPIIERKLGDVVGQFKSFTTNLYGEGVREVGWTPWLAPEKRASHDLGLLVGALLYTSEGVA